MSLNPSYPGELGGVVEPHNKLEKLNSPPSSLALLDFSTLLLVARERGLLLLQSPALVDISGLISMVSLLMISSTPSPLVLLTLGVVERERGRTRERECECETEESE